MKGKLSKNIKGKLDNLLTVFRAKKAERDRLNKEQISQTVAADLGEQSDKAPTVIDDLSDKLLEAEIKLSASSLQNQHITAQNIVKTHMIAASSLALLPVPLFDLAALTGFQINLLRTLSLHFGVEFNEQKSKALLTSLVSGSIPLVAVMGLSSVSKLVPGIGTVGGGISMAVLTNATVYATGQVFINHFEKGGSLDDFEAKHWKEFFVKSLEQQKITRRTKTESDLNDGSIPTEVSSGALNG